MTALLDWSYDLLTPREQQFFDSLSVFAGSCTLEAVTAVCAADGEDDVAVIDLIASLVTKSLLVRRIEMGASRRYSVSWNRPGSMHGTNSSRADGRCKFVRRHALFYVELAERREREWDTMPDREWLPQAPIEVANWRALLEWTLASRGDVTLGQRLATVRAVMWRGFSLTEGRRWVRAALELVQEDTPARLIAQLEHSEAEGARRGGDFKTACTLAKPSCFQPRFRRLGDVLDIAQTQSFAGAMLSVLGRPARSRNRCCARLLRTIAIHSVIAVCGASTPVPIGTRSNVNR